MRSLFDYLYGYVRSYSVGVVHVRSYTIIEGAFPRSATHLAEDEPYISLSVREGVYICFREIRSQNERYGLGNKQGHLQGNSRRYKVVDSLR